MKPLRMLKRWLKSRPAVQRWLYERRNRNQFASPWVHELMLADKLRVDTYRRAIDKLIGPNDVVVDLGTGTGILSQFASHRNPRKIYAIDHSEIIDTARKVAAYNGVNGIEFIRVSSQQLKLPEKVDVILHEQIGPSLFDENMVENIVDLRDRLLRPGGKILPGRFDLFLEPVTLKAEFRIPFIWEFDLHGVRYDCMRPKDEHVVSEHDSWSSYYLREVNGYEVDSLLCDPVPVMSFDLETLRPADLPKTLRYRKTVARAGQMDVIGLFFRVAFDDDIYFDTSPLSPRTHFGMWSYRVDALELRPRDQLDFDWKIGDLRDMRTWDYRFQKV